ncbi:MAG TPA: hypothetical protein VGK73_25205 [Polyangiaceae bacterium]
MRRQAILGEPECYSIQELVVGKWVPAAFSERGICDRDHHSSRSEAETVVAEHCEQTGENEATFRVVEHNDETGAPMPIVKPRSGRTRSYAERRKLGKVAKRVSAELDQRTLDRLNAICEHEGGWSHADMIRAMIDATWMEMRDAGELK